MRRVLPLATIVLASCPEPAYPPVDLTAPLGPGQVRAGRITDPSVLFGGIAAEGRVGDALLVNDRARFVIQGPRDGHFYFRQGGCLLDADIVRPAGSVGRDIVEEWGTLVGGPRLLDPIDATVIDSGVGSDRARLLVRGTDSPIEIITGAVESEDLVPHLGLEITNDYVLRPDSWFLEVTTTVTATEEAQVDLGDLLMVGIEVADRWRPGAGMDPEIDVQVDWLGAIARGNDVAVMLATPDGRPLVQTIPLLGELGDVDLGVGTQVRLQPGDSARYTRWFGVGPDLATLTDELLERRGTPFVEVGGTVTAADGPVPMARVAVFVDDAPWTVAVTDPAGAWTARVPDGRAVSWRAVGRGTGWNADLPGETGNWSPFLADEARAAWLDRLEEGGGPIAPEGRGVASVDAPLVLGEPGRIVVRTDDGQPFEVRARRQGPDPAVDARIVPDRPSNATAWGWARDGAVTLLVEPGTYDLLAHRGARFERDAETVTVGAGQEVTVAVDLPAAYAHPGWILADPHQHASPSNDGQVTMEERILVNAARGLQLPFGTDHDRIADYNDLIRPLGLDRWVRSVVANEVSPVRRGHINAYPLTLRPEEENGGAWLWYADLVPDTPTEFARLRERYPDALLQANHPLDNGLLWAARWTPGVIGRPDFFSDDFDAIEVVNSGTTYMEAYLDLASRGLRVTPVGVSDAHGPTSGGIGFNATWIGLGTDDPTAYTDDALREAMHAGRTIVTRGPFLDVSVEPGSVVPAGTTVDVDVLAPSWMDVDTIELWRNVGLETTVEGTSATFTLDPATDDLYVIVAYGHEAADIVGRPAWAMTGAIYVDVGGDGWTAPLPPLAR